MRRGSSERAIHGRDALLRAMLRAMFRQRSLVLGLCAVLASVVGCHRGAATGESMGETEGSPIAEGQVAPDFDAVAHDGVVIKPSALKGRPVVLYFYPRDETPGCTKEACAFRDAWNELAKTNVVLVGISTDDAASHTQFARNHELPFQLVSDPSGAIAKAYGVPNRAGFLARQTIVIGADGKVKKIHRTVDVKTHANQILADLTS